MGLVGHVGGPAGQHFRGMPGEAEDAPAGGYESSGHIPHEPERMLHGQQGQRAPVGKGSFGRFPQKAELPPA